MASMFPREQEALNSYFAACSIFERHQKAAGISSLNEFSTLYSECFGFFGITELVARQAERYDVAGIESAYSAKLLSRSKELNDKGLDVLARARESLSELSKNDEAPWNSKKLKEEFEAVEKVIIEQIVEWEIKPSDVKKLKVVVSECFDVAQKGRNAFSEYMLSKIDELDRVRREPDRGSRDNISVWKAIGIAIFLGAWVWGFVSCLFFRCTASSTAAPGVLMLIGLAMALFC
jgi:hypothetical protein